MLVKEFVAVSCFDYVNIIMDGEFVEEYSKDFSTELLYGEAEVVAVNPIKGGGWLTGVELEVELPNSTTVCCPECGKLMRITLEEKEEFAGIKCSRCGACAEW